MNYKKLYEEHHGPIPQDYEIHHIIPRYAGGTDDISNLVALSKEDHKKAHMERYEKYGDFRDLCAYHMIGYNFSEAHQVSSSEGGKIGGTKVYDTGVGIFRSEKERKIWAAMGGRIGGKMQKENGLGIHTPNKELRLQWASKGGKASGVFQDPKRQSEFGKRGGVKNKGFRWYIDENGNNKKYTPTQQINENFEDFIKRTQFTRGRK
jgi:hypothetical protein